ncbi:arsenate reductase (glutaredoxin) [Pedobacter punctiformis]|uniref:Arsenate reductase (Glutaredoxin) n=1 Tax=Pedobacter punctiformis TaxID=3004097 RepID=A0ABT4L8I0_9SPHI|nr:arsenate reductase (glutaredoxin) [Pedobacter sp. HCMS5-2]MCZ4244242.1 arsenate reductase (glutaredoxin) [Pedobacter sp. HCMS5-2]
MIKIYHNNKCSKSRSALSILNESGKDFELINYLQQPPTAEELATIINKLGIKPFELIRKGEAIYTEKYKGKDLSDAQWIEAMVQNPVLIERPIIVSGDQAVIARPTEKIYEILD